MAVRSPGNGAEASVYLGQLVLQDLLWGSDAREECVQQISRRLCINLLLAEVNFRHFDGLGRRKTQHLLRMHAALEDICEDVTHDWSNLVT